MNKFSTFCLSLTIIPCIALAAAQPVAKVTYIQGTAQILKIGSADWKLCKPNTPLAEGDQLFSEKESIVEVRYAMGAVIRLGESAKVTVGKCSETAASNATAIGDVWVNMKKITAKREFEISSPTATAAIRGTVFQISTAADSSTDVSVVNGKVAVGPSKQMQKTTPSGSSRTEVSGPEEIPGPYEVSLDQWRLVVAGQHISVRRDGKFAIATSDSTKKSEFAKKNIELDKKLMEEK